MYFRMRISVLVDRCEWKRLTDLYPGVYDTINYLNSNVYICCMLSRYRDREEDTMATVWSTDEGTEGGVTTPGG